MSHTLNNRGGAHELQVTWAHIRVAQACALVCLYLATPLGALQMDELDMTTSVCCGASERHSCLSRKYTCTCLLLLNIVVVLITCVVSLCWCLSNETRIMSTRRSSRLSGCSGSSSGSGEERNVVPKAKRRCTRLVQAASSLKKTASLNETVDAVEKESTKVGQTVNKLCLRVSALEEKVKTMEEEVKALQSEMKDQIEQHCKDFLTRQQESMKTDIVKAIDKTMNTLKTDIIEAIDAPRSY